MSDPSLLQRCRLAAAKTKNGDPCGSPSEKEQEDWTSATLTPAATAAFATIATAEAAAATATAITAAAEASTAALTTGGEGTIFLRASLVDLKLTTANVLAVEGLDRLLGARLIRHGHEGETARLPGKLVQDNGDFGDTSNLREERLKL
jgi:hypothetical protein